jgi:hypothetical protein
MALLASSLYLYSTDAVSTGGAAQKQRGQCNAVPGVKSRPFYPHMQFPSRSKTSHIMQSPTHVVDMYDFLIRRLVYEVPTAQYISWFKRILNAQLASSLDRLIADLGT